MTAGRIREKSSQSERIHFVALRDEKNREVCLISDKEIK
jgi:hypothetical protein